MIGLLKAIGCVVSLPVTVIADAVTLGGVLVEKRTTYTGDACKRLIENIEEATRP